MVIRGCGNKAKIKTSWTDRNPGRRFYGCRMEATNYGFFGWVDPPMCERSLDVLEEDIEDHVLMLREKEQMITKLRKYLVVACVMDIHDEVEFKIHKNGYFEFHPLRLVEYYLNNIGLDGTDGEKKRKVLDSKKVHRGVNMKTKDVVRNKQKCLDKGKGKANEDEEVLRHTNKDEVTNYSMGFDNGKAIMIEDVGVVNKKGRFNQGPVVL
ncbi:zinc finger, GRF-type containing protein [Tanacetum coccineum]